MESIGSPMWQSLRIGMNEQAEMIRRRAYEIWKAEGQPDGRALEHWCRAEAETLQPRPAATGKKRGASTRAKAKAKP